MMRYLPMLESYELEDVKKRTDETINVLIDHICQLAHCALMGDGSYAAVEFQVKCRLVHAIPDDDVELQKELLKVSQNKGVSHLLEICHIYYAIESGVAAICADKKNQCFAEVPLTLKATTETFLTVLKLHMPAPTWAWQLPCLRVTAKVVWRKDIGKPSVTSAIKTNPLLQWTPNQKICLVSMEGMGRRLTV